MRTVISAFPENRARPRYGLLADHLAESAGERAFGHEIDFNAQQASQVHEQATLVEKRSARLKTGD